jgi:hypothetical protein
MPFSPDGPLRAFLVGWRRVLTAPALLFGLWLTMAAIAAPFAGVVRDAVERHLGNSTMAATVAAGVESRWWLEFRSQASGLGATLSPSVIGFAAVLSNLSGVADGVGLPTALIAPVGAFGLAWIFLAGGVLDRFARARRLGSRAFFGACGVFFFRFLRLALLGAIGYAAAAAVWWLLIARVFPWITRDLTSERLAFAWLVCLYAVGLVPLMLVNVSIDYARVRAVVEDRRSMVGALLAAIRFIARHPGHVALLYLLNTVVLLGVLALYGTVAPGSRGGDWRLLAILLWGQAYVLARLATRLAFQASAVALFQHTLAHAAYTAFPPPVWPDSPAAEAIENAARYGTRPTL